MINEYKIKRALISVSDKTHLEELAEVLRTHNVQIISTGGSAKFLRDAGYAVTDIEVYTGFPEIMNGRVKTLHPLVHGGILARRDLPEHLSAMDGNGIRDIDLVVVNLYPFAKTIRGQCAYDDAIENIDIGGPAMIRSAAKNHQFVTILTNPSQYQELIDIFNDEHRVVTFELRQRLAAEAFDHTARYDQIIADWFYNKALKDAQEDNYQDVGEEDALPEMPQRFSITAQLKTSLRYGENPHQSAGIYDIIDDYPLTRRGINNAKQHQGKDLSYNNLADAEAALALSQEFSDPAVAIIKHANPCGVAIADTIEEAYSKALKGDPVSAFGGIVAMNRPLTPKLAEALTQIFLEVIITPHIEEDAIEILASKKKLRVLETGISISPAEYDIKAVSGNGLLLQSPDFGRISERTIEILSYKQPSDACLKSMVFAFQAVKHVKSNAILLARNGMSVGVGAGQMSRVEAARIALLKYQELEKAPKSGTLIAASDAFFPFADGVERLIEGGVKAFIQPGGAQRDQEVIDLIDKHGLIMAFTNQRHFKH